MALAPPGKDNQEEEELGVRKKGRPFTMRFLHRNEEMAWERAQRSTMTNWCNYILKPFVFFFFFFFDFYLNFLSSSSFLIFEEGNFHSIFLDLISLN